MKKINCYYVIGIVLLLMLSSITYANSSLERFGFIESIEDRESNKNKEESFKVVSVSGKKYIFNWDTIKVIYKNVYVNVSGLEEGMKIKFNTSSTQSEKITLITILSEHDMLINN
ncbi:MAG: hypothetical protein OQL19_03375 [Gammaproteobacteria bacterium]|nr:hypothetical protein [Gammaproteobacteria bacterium]